METEIRKTFRAVVHKAEEGGYWAEVLELPGCVSQGETRGELRENVTEAILDCLDEETPVMASVMNIKIPV